MIGLPPPLTPAQISCRPRPAPGRLHGAGGEGVGERPGPRRPPERRGPRPPAALRRPLETRPPFLGCFLPMRRGPGRPPPRRRGRTAARERPARRPGRPRGPGAIRHIPSRPRSCRSQWIFAKPPGTPRECRPRVSHTPHRVGKVVPGKSGPLAGQRAGPPGGGVGLGGKSGGGGGDGSGHRCSTIAKKNEGVWMNLKNPGGVW